jgi:dimethylargininase
MFTKAIVKQPAANFADGLTTVDLGRPDFAQTLRQHQAYCAALVQCGLSLTHLPADEHHPDSTFVEDVAIVTPAHGALLTLPGAASRAGEVAHMKTVLPEFYADLAEMQAPATLDGGDICEAGSHFLIGVSLRTNFAGARQLATWLEARGYTCDIIDIRQTPGILHLKSGIAFIGDGVQDQRMVVIDALAGHPALARFDLVRVAPEEDYAANCVRVNDFVLMAKGYPKLEATLRGLGYQLIVLDMSEYQKMDGGLSCLSLRF